MTTSRESGRRAARAGTTLVELMIALVVLGLVSTALTTAIVRQQRANARTVASVGMRNQGRITLSALAAELKGVSSSGGDINPGGVAGEMTATTLSVRVPIGASIICHIASTTSFSIPPIGELNGGRVLSGFLDPDDNQLPDGDDLVFVYDPSRPTATPWIEATLANRIGPKGSGACPSGANTPLTAVEANGDYLVTLNGAVPLSAKVIVGSPVRFVRVVRYTFAQDAAGDGQWYLWYQRCSLAGCSAAAPVSGPFLPATADMTTTGFRFRYYDSAGLETADRLAVARIDVFARPTTREKVSTGGGATRATLTPSTKDSLTIALRNRY